MGVSVMELQDIKSIDGLKDQAGIYGVMIGQIADNLQDVKKLVSDKVDIDVYSDFLDQVSEAQSRLYEAAKILAEVDEE